MENTLTEKNSRIYAADVLRAFAVIGITLLHAIEHYNFYSFPDTSTQPVWLNFTDKAIWDSMFFTFGGKGYGIFALLFGFSFFIQDDNQLRRGNDFRVRFLWRLFLLFLIGNVNAIFFTAEILVMYSLLGIILVCMCRLSNKTILTVAILFLLQPVEWFNLILTIINPEYVPVTEIKLNYWGITAEAQANAGFWEMYKVNLWEGQLASLTWAWNHGRIFQTMALFLFGFLIGRTQFLVYNEKNMKVWLTILAISLVCYFPLTGLNNMLPGYVENTSTLKAANVILQSLANFCFMWLLIIGILFLFYFTRFQQALLKLAPYGRMSLTNYVTQSIIGSFLFYNWGLGLHKYLGITSSLLVGILLVALQVLFCRWWLSRNSHGPFEGVWKKATWI